MFEFSKCKRGNVASTLRLILLRVSLLRVREFVSENSRSFPSGNAEAFLYELKMAAVAARTRCRLPLPESHENSRTITGNANYEVNEIT